MKIKVRVSILSAMIALVIFSCMLIIYISYSTGLSSVNNVLDKLVNLVSKSAIERSIDFFVPAEKVLRSNVQYQKLILKDGAASSGGSYANEVVAKIISHTDAKLYTKYGLSRGEIESFLKPKIAKSRGLVEYNTKAMRDYEEFRSIEGAGFDKDFTAVIRMADGSFSVKYVLPYRSGRGEFVISVWNHSNAAYYTDDFKNPVSGRIADFKNNIQSIHDEEIYDPLTRSWFTGAVANYNKAKAEGKETEIFWSEPRVFFSDEAPGVSASVPVIDDNGKVMYVCSINIGTIGMSTGYLEGLKIGQKGRVMVFNDLSEIIAYSPESSDKDVESTNRELRFLIKQLPKYGDKSNPKKITGYDFKLTPAAEAQNKLFAAAYKSGEPRFKNVMKNGKITLPDTFRSNFLHNGTSFVAIFIPFPESFHWNWILSIIVPEDEFLGQVKHNTVIMLSVSVIALILSIFIAFYLSTKITKSLDLLVEEANEIRLMRLESPNRIQTSLYELDKMSTAFYNMKVGLRSFEKYVPSDLVRYLIQTGNEANLGGEQKKLTVSFVDIENFTTISESLPPQKLVKALGDFLGEMSAIITANEGTIDKYIGDSIMAFWGAPKEIEDHAYLACKAAIEEQERLDNLRGGKWSLPDTPKFNSRIGITTGDLIVGNIGAVNRLNYTVIGDTVNLASRLEGLNKYYGTNVLCSEFTNELIKERIVTRKIDIVSVKGKTLPVGVYEVICLREKSNPSIEDFVKKFEDAYYYYSIRQFASALNLFTEIKASRPNDKATAVFIERCTNYVNDPPSKEWNGIYKHTSK
jgi:adenylate cyclase